MVAVERELTETPAPAAVPTADAIPLALRRRGGTPRQVLALTLVRGWWRLVCVPPVLYLAAFVWENVMLAKPEPTRYIVLGVLLISLMIVRPNGLFGEKRVEII